MPDFYFEALNHHIIHIERTEDEVKASRCVMSYHNKHKDGSGNFGFVIVFAHEGTKDAGCGIRVANESWFALHGHYSSQKQVYGLNFGDYSRPISQIPNDWTFAQISEYMNKFIIAHEDPAKFVVS